MKNENSLREHVLNLLRESGAHADFDTAIKELPISLRGEKPRGAAHSAWEVLEHMRIAQWDLLEFARNPKHVSPVFPEGYWPTSQGPQDNEAWEKSVNAFRADLNAIVEMVKDESNDLLAAVKAGEGQTILRQALLAADHNGYHLGEMVLIRRLLQAW